MSADANTPKPKDKEPVAAAKPAPKKAPATPDDQKIHVLNAPEVKKRSSRASRRRKIITWSSFIALVILPVIAVGVYLYEYAADRYAVETKFSVRSPSAVAPASDLMSMVTSMSSSGSTTSDSYMLVDFVESRDLIDQLNQRLDLRAIYDTDKADFLTRLESDATIEDLQKYLKRFVSIHYDASSQILTLEVQTFDPASARELSEAILEISSNLINELSEQARFDSMNSAQAEVERIEQRLDDHRQIMSTFRSERQDFDPAASAGAQLQLLTQLEGELANAQTRMKSLLEYLAEDAPTVRVLQTEIESLERQIAQQRDQLSSATTQGATSGNPDGTNIVSLAERIAIYESLQVDLQFLQSAYISALSAREAARLEADRQQRYIASFVKPTTPEDSLYPRRERNMLVFIGFAIMLWAIGLMVFYVVREHAN